MSRKGDVELKETSFYSLLDHLPVNYNDINTFDRLGGFLVPHRPYLFDFIIFSDFRSILFYLTDEL